MKKTRRKFTNQFKAQEALETLKEWHSLSNLAERFELHPTHIAKRKKDFSENASAAFEVSGKKEAEEVVDVDRLYSKIGGGWISSGIF